MKFLNWMQSKMKGRHEDKKLPTTNDTTKEELNEWRGGLLAIGTFGNTKIEPEEEQCSSPDFSEFTAEEVGKLKKELKKLLSRKPPASKPDQEPSMADLPLDRFLNCPSSLEVDRTNSSRFSTYSDDKDEQEIDRTIRIILGRCKDVCDKKKKKTIGKNSLTFLVKKMFACRTGFSPAPGIRDPFQESRMEKLMRIMLTKKMNAQKPSRSPSTKKYIEGRRLQPEDDYEQESHDESGEGSKWDKTDSEYIVLEI